GQEKDTPRIGSVNDQMGHAVGERVCLAGARSGNDQERIGETVICNPDAVFHGPSLLQIELVEISGAHSRIIRVGASRCGRRMGKTEAKSTQRLVLLRKARTAKKSKSVRASQKRRPPAKEGARSASA